MDIRKAQALRDILKDAALLKEKCYIDGKWVGGKTAIDVTNPVDESVIATVPKLGADETRAAIEAAQRAQKDWAKKTAKERAAILRKWFNLMMENQEDLAQIMTPSRASRCSNRVARSPMARPSSNSSPKRPSASMARPFLRPGPMAA